MAGPCADYNLPGRLVSQKLSTRAAYLVGVVVSHFKQFRLRLARRPGLPSEIVAALWQKGVHIQVFFVEVEEDQDIFHLAVDKTSLARQAFFENGWHADEETKK
jgi:hypothetical protein